MLGCFCSLKVSCHQTGLKKKKKSVNASTCYWRDNFSSIDQFTSQRMRCCSSDISSSLTNIFCAVITWNGTTLRYQRETICFWFLFLWNSLFRKMLEGDTFQHANAFHERWSHWNSNWNWKQYLSRQLGAVCSKMSSSLPLLLWRATLTDLKETFSRK